MVNYYCSAGRIPGAIKKANLWLIPADAENNAVCLTIENPAANTNDIDTGRLFERFYKANTSRNEQGTGLGLSIAQLLTKSLGGSISARVVNDLFVVELVFSKFEE